MTSFTFLVIGIIYWSGTKVTKILLFPIEMQKNSYFFAVNSMSKSVYAAVPALASLKTGIFKDGTPS